jgi:hypothetical protein
MSHVACRTLFSEVVALGWLAFRRWRETGRVKGVLGKFKNLGRAEDEMVRPTLAGRVVVLDQTTPGRKIGTP